VQEEAALEEKVPESTTEVHTEVLLDDPKPVNTVNAVNAVNAEEPKAEEEPKQEAGAVNAAGGVPMVHKKKRLKKKIKKPEGAEGELESVPAFVAERMNADIDELPVAEGDKSVPPLEGESAFHYPVFRKKEKRKMPGAVSA
jgi:hypothetical protein